MADETALNLFQIARLFFDEDDWNYTLSEEGNRLEMRFQGHHGLLACLCWADEELEQVFFYSIIGVSAPEERRHEVAEYLCRANYGLHIGNFELDFRDGEIRYKTSVDVEGGLLTVTMMKNLVYTNVTTADRYLPGLMAVLYGGKTPAEAIEQVERGGSEE